MSLQSLRRALAREVRTPANVRLFEAEAPQHLVLAGHSTVMSVLSVLTDERAHRYTERDLLVRTVIDVHQRSPRPLWAAVLLVACLPMLERLRGRIVGNALSGPDLDQLVVTHFLEVVTSYALDRHFDRTFLRLRQQTEARAFAAVRDSRREQERVGAWDPEELELRIAEALAQGHNLGWPGRRARRVPNIDPTDAPHVEALLRELGEGRVPADGLDLLVKTLAWGRRIRSIADEMYPGLEGAARRRAYDRIKRRHWLALDQLRDVILSR